MTNGQQLTSPTSPTSPTSLPTSLPESPLLPPVPVSESPSSAPSSPALSPSSTSKPMLISIAHTKSLEPPSASPKQRGSIAAHLMHFASRSTTSLHLLSSSAPENSSPGSSPQDPEVQSQTAATKSGFSNPFKKLHNPFSTPTRKNSDPNVSKDAENVISSASSVHSMISWRSKGAEMFSKKHWSRGRKNSEPVLSVKGMPPTPIFGTSLEDAVRASHITGTPMVPAVLYRCALYLEAKGADEVGLYRVPGSHANVQKLKKMFDTGKDLDLLAMEALDPNDIATLLKLYLRELPSPLLPAAFVEQFQSVISTDRQVCHSLRGMLIRLPRPNYVALSFLCHHLSKIASYAERTKMNISNLGVVFAPTLSIGSVLFKALLGGYYDPGDSLDSREKGLKIVWGGLLQDLDYNGRTWAENSFSEDGQPCPLSVLTPAQELVNATMGPSATAASAAAAAAAAAVSSASTAPTTPTELIAPTTLITPTISIVPTAATEAEVGPSSLIELHDSPAVAEEAANETSDDDVETAEDEEAKLMAAMLLREELSAKGQDDDETASNASSDSIPCTETTALSTVSSPGVDAKEQAFEMSFTSPSILITPEETIPSTISAEGQDVFSSPSPSPQILTTSEAVIPAHSQEPSSPPLLESKETVTESYPELPTMKITIDSGSVLESETESAISSDLVKSELSSEIATKVEEVAEDEEEEEEEEGDLHVSEFTHKRISVAPQLPPLEGLMISL